MPAYATDAWSQVFWGAQSGREISSFLLSKSSVAPQKHLAVFIPHTAITQVVPVGSGDIPRTSFPDCTAVAQNSEPVPGVCASLPLIFTCYLKQSRKGAVLQCQLSPAVLKGFFLLNSTSAHQSVQCQG